MKLMKLLFCSFVAAALFSAGLFAQETVESNGPLTLEQPGGWTLVILPDPQNYTSTRNAPILTMMMNWLVDQREAFNIKNVVCVGDLVNNNSSTPQWNLISDGFAILDGKLPYVPATGNHDYGSTPPSGSARHSMVSRYFTPDRNSAWNDVLVEMGENGFGERNLENAAYVHTAPNGQKVVILCLQFAPSDKNIDWAKEFAARPENQDAFILVVTHVYIHFISRDNTFNDARNYPLLRQGGNTGLDIWNKLVKPSPNIRMVMCGHHSGNDDMTKCTGFRVDQNDAGKSVYQMLFDTQELGGGNGGDGWLRLLEFSADMKNVKVRTFSPLFDISPSTRSRAEDQAEYSRFEFNID